MNISISTDSNAPTTRGNKFALAFMRDSIGRAEITLYITTEQNVSNFTIETKLPGLTGFNEASPDSGLFSRIGTARRGEFTFIHLQAAANISGLPDLSVQSNGNNDTSDRQKGLILTADNQSDELTVYALSSTRFSTGTFMAINCVEFPTARDYQYFIFSLYFIGSGSQFLMTPCQDNTTIHVKPSQPYAHPSWVNPSVQRTTPGTSQEEAIYGRHFNRFDTLLLINDGDLTGTIITSDKPLSVFSGISDTSGYCVEQIPSHPTYGDLFFLLSIEPDLFFLLSIEPFLSMFRIGSISDEAFIQVNCPCEPGSVSNGNRVPLSGSGALFTAVINRGQYVECFFLTATFCSVQSTRPVTVMSYQSRLGYSMVYTPPVDSYLTRYSLTSLSGDDPVSLSYTLQDLNSPGLLVNGDVLTPSDGFTNINCRSNCFESMVCGRGATEHFDQQTFDIQFSGDVPFWGCVQSFAMEVRVTYPLPFEMRPIGCKFYIINNFVLIYFTSFLQWPGSKLKTLLLWKLWI